MSTGTGLRHPAVALPGAPGGGAKRRAYFALLCGWVALTFVLTSIPDLSVPLDAPHSDKAAHLLFYAVMGFLCAGWRRACGASVARAALYAVVFAALAGAVDEAHQFWIPGRSTDRIDWLADAAGGGIGAVISGVAARAIAART